MRMQRENRKPFFKLSPRLPVNIQKNRYYLWPERTGGVVPHPQATPISANGNSPTFYPWVGALWPRRKFMKQDGKRYPLLEEYLTLRALPMKAAFTLRDVAEIFRTSIRTIQSWIANQKLNSRDLPGRATVLPEDLENLLARPAPTRVRRPSSNGTGENQLRFGNNAGAFSEKRSV
jgi:hypothetical protein